MTRLTFRLLLDLGRIKKRGDDGRGADADRNSGFHEFRPPFLAGSFIFVTHQLISMAFGGALEAA